MARNPAIREVTRKLKERCGIIAETLRFRGLASDVELEAYLPGGSENREGSELEQWIFAVSNYTRLCERIGTADERREAALSGNQDEVIAALADSTESVTLSTGVRMTVHPKSFETLRVIERLDQRIGWLAEKRAHLALRNEKADLDLLDRAVAEMGYIYQLIAWCAVHEGVGLPFTEDELEPKVPAHLVSLSPTDFAALRMAFLRVNAIRLHVLLTMLSEKKAPEPGARQSWATFFALREQDSHTPSRTLIRDRSLASQLAASLLAADAHETMRAEAEHANKAVA